VIAAVVTGAAMGIGEAVARRLLEEGAVVVGVDRDAAALEETASRLGARMVPLVGDIADWSTHANAADLAEQHGDLAWWVNNAGIECAYGPLQDRSAEEFDRLIGADDLGVPRGIGHLEHALGHPRTIPVSMS